MKILLISTLPPLRKSFPKEMEAHGFPVVVTDEEGAEQALQADSHDAVVVDVNPADESILSLIPIWRQQGIDAGIVVLLEESAGPHRRARCLELGADVVLTKPVQTVELQARLRALLRRQEPAVPSTYQIGDLDIDPARRTVRRGAKDISLTPREFELLEFLITRRGKVVTRSMIREHLFHHMGGRGSNVVDVYVRYLRRKLDEDATAPLIITHWGRGYEFRAETTNTP